MICITTWKLVTGVLIFGWVCVNLGRVLFSPSKY
jgi:hypothetical protein